MNVKRGATGIQYVLSVYDLWAHLHSFLTPLSENLTNNIIKLVSGQTGVYTPCDPEQWGFLWSCDPWFYLINLILSNAPQLTPSVPMPEKKRGCLLTSQIINSEVKKWHHTNPHALACSQFFCNASSLTGYTLAFRELFTLEGGTFICNLRNLICKCVWKGT